MKKKALLFFSFISVSVSCWGQHVSSFSSNPDFTVKELTAFFETTSKAHKDVAEQMIKEFPLFWNSIADQEQLVFIELSNLMLKRKMNPVPQFSDFILTYKSVIETNQSTKSFKAFVSCLKYHIEKNNIAQYGNVLEIYRNVIKEHLFNTYTGGTRWVAQNVSSYYFDFDTVPKIVFPSLTIHAGNGKDSIVIKNTSGYFLPDRFVFVGKKGTLDWTKAGEPNTYVTFESYSISTRSLRIEIPDVLYHNPAYFPKPQKGILEDRIMTTEVDEETSTYPRFTSDDKNIKVDNIYQEVNYTGGVYVRGTRFLGQGDKDNLATLIFEKEGLPVIKISSSSFVLRKDQASGMLCNMTIYLDKDSIYHSAIQLKYTPNNREIWLMRGKNGTERMPFFDTYHNIEIYSDALNWKINNANIEFTGLPGPVEQTGAIFESSNYFTNGRVSMMQGMSDVNPLYTLYEYFRTRKVKKATLDDIVRHFGYSKNDVQSLLFQFTEYGFIDFNVLSNEIIYRQKLGNYLLNDVNKRDYDIIQFRSSVGGGISNATLSMLNYDLTIRGLDLIVISDSQIVNVFPAGRQITMQKNRDFLFHGKVEAGLLDYWVTNSKFDYDQFKMDFTVIDSIVLYVEDKSQYENYMGEYPLVKVRSYIQDISGTLYIDLPDNKSSRKSSSGYPYFESKSPGKVYYDHPFVHGGIYDRERFYFSVDRFTIRDLDDYDTDSLLFAGYLYSGGIFPDIHIPLRVRPDFSLGFVYNTGEGGLPAYQGRGIFTSKIDLSNLGLRCTGTLDYTQSHAEGKNMLFFLDSMNASFDTYRIDAQQIGAEFPAVTAKNTRAHWEPYNDKMFVNNTNTLFKMYDNSTLDGQLVVSFNGVKGSGKFNYNIADMNSKDYTFLHHELQSPTLDIALYDSLSDDYHFKATNHKAHVDLLQGRGNFIANEGPLAIVFPINMFTTNSKEFDWLVREKKLTFKYEDPFANVDLLNTEIRELYEMHSSGNELVSIHPAQDSLQFTVTKASYDFARYEILAEGVRFIEIADAAIFPYKGIVKIYKRAEIAKLDNAKVLANTTSKYHEIFKAGINIGSRKTYNGEGFYNYVDASKKKQEFLFDSIWVNRSLQTRASGRILQEANFTLNPHFGYAGNVFLNAEDEFLSYRGAVSLQYVCDTFQYAPVRFSGIINPDTVLIPVNEKTKDTDNRPVVAAITSSATGGRIYTAFARSKDQLNDAEYVNATGFLTFNEEMDSYIVTSREKIDDLEMEGNIISLNKKTCIARGEGKLDLGTNLGRVSFVPIGHIVNFIQEDSAIINIALAIDFHFNDDAMKIMADKIEASQNLEGIDILDLSHYHTALREIMGKDNYRRNYQDLVQYYHFRRLPKDLMLNFLIADINMEWKQDDKAFVSNGNIGIAICGKRELNRYVPGLVEVQKKGSNKNSKTTLQMYFELDNQWFYFKYSGTTMEAYSSIKEFNDAIDNTKQDKRMLKADSKKDLSRYAYRKSSLAAKRKFLAKYATEEEEE
ncbi:MAG: hypothetical protein LBE13_19520 [Bacteroidales bacterium]|jgi:hypothetical protein|nr:hypothetical protein [Bacteroidales bacterium]